MLRQCPNERPTDRQHQGENKNKFKFDSKFECQNLIFLELQKKDQFRFNEGELKANNSSRNIHKVASAAWSKCSITDLHPNGQPGPCPEILQNKENILLPKSSQRSSSLAQTILQRRLHQQPGFQRPVPDINKAKGACSHLP